MPIDLAIDWHSGGPKNQRILRPTETPFARKSTTRSCDRTILRVNQVHRPALLPTATRDRAHPPATVPVFRPISPGTPSCDGIDQCFHRSNLHSRGSKTALLRAVSSGRKINCIAANRELPKQARPALLRIEQTTKKAFCVLLRKRLTVKHSHGIATERRCITAKFRPHYYERLLHRHHESITLRQTKLVDVGPACITASPSRIATGPGSHCGEPHKQAPQPERHCCRSTCSPAGHGSDLAADYHLGEPDLKSRRAFRLLATPGLPSYSTPARRPHHLTAAGVRIASRRLGIRNTFRRCEPEGLSAIRIGRPYDLAIVRLNWEGTAYPPCGGHFHDTDPTLR